MADEMADREGGHRKKAKRRMILKHRGTCEINLDCGGNAIPKIGELSKYDLGWILRA